MAAFADAFQNGFALSNRVHVLRAAHRVGLDPHAAEQAAADPQVKQALRSATDAAYERGVFGVPTIALDDELFWGDDRLEDAAVHVSAAAAAQSKP